MADEFGDVEGAVKSYLLSWAPLTALIGSRCYLSLPRQGVEYPCVDLFLVAGRDDPSPDVPMDLAVMQINAWGSIYPNGNGNKAEATNVYLQIRSALKAIRSKVLVGAVALHGATVESAIWLPDQDDSRPRYAITTQVTALSV